MGLTRQVLQGQVAISFAWTVILLPLSCLGFITLSRIQILHPIQWLTDSVSNLSSSSTFFCLLLLSLLLGMHCVFTVEFYTVVPSIPGSRLSLMGQILLPQRILHSLAHAVMGMLMSWCCAVLCKGKYQLLVDFCTPTPSLNEGGSPSTCLNEHHLFILLAGAFFGYTYSLLYFVHNMNYLSFPPVQQFKYLRFRRYLPLLLKHSCVQSLYLLRSFIVLYYFLGHIPRTWIQTVMNLQLDGQQPPLDTIRGLMNLSLFYETWLTGTFLLTTWYMVWILFRIYATESRVFPVQSSFAEEADKCLPNVLTRDNPPLLKYLALQDLMLLSQYSPSRRQEVFSLSLPGGHPHNWTAISRECLHLLNSLTSRLVTHQEAAANNGRVMLPSAAESRKSSSSTGGSVSEESAVQTPVLGAGLRAPIPSLLKSASLKSPLDTGSPFASPVVSRVSEVLDQNSPWHGAIQSPHIMRRGAKLWTCSTDGPTSASGASAFSPAPARVVTKKDKPSFIYTWYQHKQEQIKNFMSKRVLIMYLFSKHPEASSQEVFADAQVHIWALEGLSHLVAASFYEDRMGVVQTSLSAILASFLSLQEAIEKHFKLPHASSKTARSSVSFVDSSYKTLRFALRAALKTAIYRITTTFGEHLHAVPMSAEHQKKLQQFLDFKE
ncbi:nucleoporin NDC1 [Bombina bombina]|uniref:nucleoporin NDC1 n=1 Tax=Bombina bombina TaxID=8345 RepID=UPI00235B0DB5|nr:nucleoporin NDC1 [Bombina bombina]